MQIYRPFDNTDIIHRTTITGVSATWVIRGRTAGVMYLDDPGSEAPARRWPDEPMPAVKAGHIAFEPTAYPTLAEVRHRLPKYGPLWDAIEAEYRESLEPVRVPDNAADQHDRFFEAVSTA